MASMTKQVGSDWRANGSSDKGTILVTGGAGYIGSHTCVQLLEEGYRVVVVDNLDNSSEEAIERVVELTGDKGRNLTFFKVDLLDRLLLEEVFKHTAFDAVIHFAGLKAVGESVQYPLRYYHNNITGTIILLELMDQYGCKKIVFSSSATVYGQPKRVPCTEEDELQTLNPYGRTKLYIENILRDMQAASAGWQVLLLRYFNPVGAHPSGRIGEDPQGIPNNLMPFIQQVAVGRRPFLSVFGSDYPTKDGTGVRDYIHVMDLAAGHTAALRKIFTTPALTCDVYNLGTGRGQSVLEMVAGFEQASGREIPVKMCPRRPGDCSEVYALTDKAERELKWKATLTLDDMCRDQWNWARQNPWGYSNPPEEVAQAEEAERVVVVLEQEGGSEGGKKKAVTSPVSEPRTPPLIPASPEVTNSSQSTSSAGSAPSPCVLDSTPPAVAHKGSLVRTGSGSSVDSLEELPRLEGSQAVA
ncbi:hypothetical protein CLOM_g9149 [Closterium sp. NIES-68]|nr:hypothetical protein CLOM_g9149 [Closterium sp. NIES-68]GJP62136.1 hypothetical protein CLOP_g19229 [Closterium sp. NIES-67]